jgi:hypothetical protein
MGDWRGFGARGRTWSGNHPSSRRCTNHTELRPHQRPAADSVSRAGLPSPSRSVSAFRILMMVPRSACRPVRSRRARLGCAGVDGVLDDPVVDGAPPDVRGLSSTADAPVSLHSEVVPSEQADSTTNSAVTALITLPSRRSQTVCGLGCGQSSYVGVGWPRTSAGKQSDHNFGCLFGSRQSNGRYSHESHSWRVR